MVLSDTDSLGTTGDGGAGRDTFVERRAADLLLTTLSIRLTLVLGDENTASTVPGVSSVSFIAQTGALVVAGPALRVGRTGEQLADWSAAENSQGVRLTHLVWAALRVSPAGGHRGNLALVGDRVPDVAGAALAVGLVVLHHALLVVAAAHDTAGVDTALLAADVDAADSSGPAVRLGLAGELPHAPLPGVQRVAGEAVLAEAGAVVIVRHTARVGATLNVPTGVNTPVATLH